MQRIDKTTAAALPVLAVILFITNPVAKVVASITYSLCIVLFLARLAWVRPLPYLPEARSVYIVVIVYLTTLLVSVLYSPDMLDGIRRFFSQTKIIMVLVMIEIVRTERDARKYLWAGTAGGCLLSIMTIYEGFVLHVDRPPMMWNSIHGGNLLMFSALVVFLALIYERDRRVRAWSAIALLVHGMALYVNGSRGVWVAFGSAVVLFPLVAPALPWRTKLAYYGALLLLAAALAQTPYVQKRLHYTAAQFRDSMKADTALSFAGRYEMWQASMDMFIEHPVLGVGLGGWGVATRAMVKENRRSPYLLDYNQAHNIYLDALSTRGMVGFAAFLSLIGVLSVHAWKRGTGRAEQYRSLVIVTTIAFLVSGLTDTLVYIRGVYVNYIILAGLGLALCLRTGAARADPAA